MVFQNNYDLGTDYTFDLRNYVPRINQEGFYSLSGLIEALQTTTTLTNLCIESDEEPLQHKRLIIQPLCHCIATLRLHNQHHPLRSLTIFSRSKRNSNDGALAESFLIAAKQFGIHSVNIRHMSRISVQGLAEFCRDNESLKVLVLENVVISDRDSATSWPPIEQRLDVSHKFSLNCLSLDCIFLENTKAATHFKYFISLVQASALTLNIVSCPMEIDRRDSLLIRRVLSTIQIPPVEQLTLQDYCYLEHFKSSLEAGRATVRELIVDVTDCGDDDVTKRLGLILTFIQGAAELNSLTVLKSMGFDLRLPPRFVATIQACATITQIQGSGFAMSQDEARQLQSYMLRNRHLASFAANPGTYPARQMLILMRHLDNCPTGLYMLARSLPSVIAFALLPPPPPPTTPGAHFQNDDPLQAVRGAQGLPHLSDANSSNRQRSFTFT